MAGKRVKMVSEHDSAIENPNMVTKMAPMQNSIQTLRRDMKNQVKGSGGQGNGNTQEQSDRNEYSINRLFEGFLYT